MNDYLFLIIGSVVTITCFYFMAAPFFAKNPANNLVASDSEQEMSLQAIYQEINEIEMDLLMKKITQQDFRKTKEHLSIMAADYINKQPEKPENRQRQTEENPSDFDKKILSQLAEIRREKGDWAG